MVRAGRLKKYDKVIRRAQKKLTQAKALKYYDFSYEEGEKFRIIEKEDEIKRAKSLCGYYILETLVKATCLSLLVTVGFGNPSKKRR